MKWTTKPSILLASRFQSLDTNRFDCIELYSDSGAPQWRYQLRIVDRQATKNGGPPCAVVLIPAGRESEYIFNSKRGLQSVAASANCSRLIAVAFQRLYHYASQESVQEELREMVVYLCQDGIFLLSTKQRQQSPKLENSLQIPFLALQGLGERNVLARGSTPSTGEYIVEQTLVESQQWARRLYFLNNPNVIQSQVYLKQSVGCNNNYEDDLLDDEEDGQKNNQGQQIDTMQLAFEYHTQMVAGYLMLQTNRPHTNALVVGLGGGGLPNFLQTTMFERVTAVELDPGVVEIARKHFELNESINVMVGNGLEIGNKLPLTEQQDLLVIDVDSKDISVGMTCPPKDFVSTSYLEKIKSLVQGVLAINVSARDPALLQQVESHLLQVYGDGNVYLSKDDSSNEDDEEAAVNVVLFAVQNASPNASETDHVKSQCDKMGFIPELTSDIINYATELKTIKQQQTKKNKKKRNSKKR